MTLNNSKAASVKNSEELKKEQEIPETIEAVSNTLGLSDKDKRSCLIVGLVTCCFNCLVFLFTFIVIFFIMMFIGLAAPDNQSTSTDSKIDQSRIDMESYLVD